MIVLQYQVEGEKNMPYQLSKITIISTAEGEQNKGENTNVESGKTTEEQTTTDENNRPITTTYFWAETQNVQAKVPTTGFAF